MVMPRRALVLACASLLLAGCATSVAGSAKPTSNPASVPSATSWPPSRTVAPQRIQFRLVMQDLSGGGGVTSTPHQPGSDVLADRDGHRYLLAPPAMDGTQVASATAEPDQRPGNWLIQITLTSTGAQTFAQLTQDNIGRQLAVVVDDVVITAPTLQAAIRDGKVQIAGTFTRDAATRLADQINGR